MRTGNCYKETGVIFPQVGPLELTDEYFFFYLYLYLYFTYIYDTKKGLFRNYVSSTIKFCSD